ncbi:hypothetical protein J4450_08085 [Candidatus Micrarchaeota archaeon]|nr:hypothetical protein [Candidatus Micrarchaeota archaeon]
MKFIEDNDGKKQAQHAAPSSSYFDINQLELAVINNLLERNMHAPLSIVSFTGLPERTLQLQKTNLERLLRKLKREHREQALQAELKKILSGEKVLPIRCFPTLKPAIINF